MDIEKEIISSFRSYKTDSEIYHDLMQSRVREILLVTSLYDAFILEEEEKLNEKIFGEYYNLSLASAPRITNAVDASEALRRLSEKKFDLVILSIRVKGMSSFELAEKIKQQHPSLPLILLLYDNTEIAKLRDQSAKIYLFEKVFVWNRDTKIFITIINYIEDKLNVENDTHVGLVRVILLVENSIRYYSRYLPILYNEIIKQTQRLITLDNLDEAGKILRMRARPKVLMAETYEEAADIYERFNEYLLCVISDVKFPQSVTADTEAGIRFLENVREENSDLPFLLQSSDEQFRETAIKHSATFINKNSDSLTTDLTKFILHNLGFGSFVFRISKDKELLRASSMYEFKLALKNVPAESIIYHGSKNHFSAWLMARGEIKIAEHLQTIKVSDFPSAESIRKYLQDIIQQVDVRNKTATIDNASAVEEDIGSSIIRLTEGSFGGKGRGLVFVNTLLQNKNLFGDISGAEIKIPKTFVIGAAEYDTFISENRISELIKNADDTETIKKLFLSSNLSYDLSGKLHKIIGNLSSPIAVRSSGIYEDSITESFSGVYQTYLLPNSHIDYETKYKQLCDAIKLVYASVYSEHARMYFEAINYKSEDEKMAVLIQEIAGSKHEDYFYPGFSGVAQSYNYYPFSRMKPDDGIAVAALGLGKYVIDGEKAFRFSPKYPRMDTLDPESQVKNSQTEFYAIDLKKSSVNLIEGEDITLARLSITDAERHGTLQKIGSVFDAQDNKFKPTFTSQGSRVVNFMSMLKFDSFPLAKILSRILEIIEASMGMPVEIEFACDLSEEKKSFYILQIKPLIRNSFGFEIDTEKIVRDELLLYTEHGMGNGMIEDIHDIIYVRGDSFDKNKTAEIASEIEKLNAGMKNKYILIGPGRWGTRDRWLGIPVNWAQISNAKIIVETDLKDFTIDASLGSHFFHNITTMNIGYFTVKKILDNSFIDWLWLHSAKAISETKYLRHVHSEKPFVIMMDGRKCLSVIYKAEES